MCQLCSSKRTKAPHSGGWVPAGWALGAYGNTQIETSGRLLAGVVFAPFLSRGGNVRRPACRLLPVSSSRGDLCHFPATAFDLNYKLLNLESCLHGTYRRYRHSARLPRKFIRYRHCATFGEDVPIGHRQPRWSRLIYKTSHSYVHHHAQREKGEDDARSTIAEQW